MIDAKGLIKTIDWAKVNGLVPAIIQDAKTLEVLMLGYMNEEAINLTFETKKVHFFSRTKQRIWMKGEESGHVLKLVDIKSDCDNDTLLILAEPVGHTCHFGTKSCFGEKRTNFLAELEDIIQSRIDTPTDASYTASLIGKGVNKVAQKVGEEATEVVIASLAETQERLISETADLIFHLLVLLKVKGLEFNNIINHLKERHEAKEGSCE